MTEFVEFHTLPILLFEEQSKDEVVRIARRLEEDLLASQEVCNVQATEIIRLKKKARAHKRNIRSMQKILETESQNQRTAQHLNIIRTQEKVIRELREQLDFYLNQQSNALITSL